MQFSLLETVVYHRWLWAELAETGERKSEAAFWSHTKINSCEIAASCFPCHLAGGNCLRCIFVELDCDEPNSPYRNWKKPSPIEDRKYWAAQIRDAELKPEFKELLGE